MSVIGVLRLVLPIIVLIFIFVMTWMKKKNIKLYDKLKKFYAVVVLAALVTIIVAVLFAPVTMNNVNAEPSFRGRVEEVSENVILVRVDTDDEMHRTSDLIYVSLNTILEDSQREFDEADTVTVYYNGDIDESYPAIVDEVYAIFELDN